jgi:plasmid stabilization system protein ParE
MVKVNWTPESVNTFNEIIEWLEYRWTEREIKNFVKATEKVVLFISEHPRMFRKTNKKDVHEALITKHNLLIYKVYPNHIDLLTFWDTRKDPKKKKH